MKLNKFKVLLNSAKNNKNKNFIWMKFLIKIALWNLMMSKKVLFL